MIRRVWSWVDRQADASVRRQIDAGVLVQAHQDASKARQELEEALAELTNLRAELARLRTVHVQPRPSFKPKPAPAVLPASPCDGRRETCLRLHDTLHAYEDRLAVAEGRPVRGGLR